MSGGHFHYSGSIIRDRLEEIAYDADVVRRWPRLGKRLTELGEALYSIEHDIDWDFCSDAAIEDDAAFEATALSVLNGTGEV